MGDRVNEPGGRPATVRRNVPPTAPPELIGRVRLDGRYRAGVGSLIRIIAPAGYGKTTLAARWVATDDRAVRWIDVERTHNDPVFLVAEIRRALAGIAQVGTPAGSVLAVPEGPADLMRVSLSTPAQDEPEAFVLVFDEVEKLDNPLAVALLHSVAEHLPASSTIVLVGRSDHDERSARLRLTPGVVDMTTDDLRLDVSESFRLLESMGALSDDPRLEDVIAALEGWPAGLRLVGHAMLAGASASEVLDDRSITEYLRSEWTNRLDADDVEFLEEVSCLERFSGSLCDRVLERSGSAERLDRLHRGDLVVFPIDRRGELHRLHPLLRRWLSDRLRRSAPQRWHEIHRRAAIELEADGEIDLAFQHAEAVREFTMCEAIIHRHSGMRLTHGRNSSVASWFAALPVDRVRSSPGLCAIRSINALHLADESGAHQWLRLADLAADAASRTDEWREEALRWVGVLHAGLEERRAADQFSALTRIRDSIADPAWRALADYLLGGLGFLASGFETAFAHLDRGVFEADLADTPVLKADGLAVLAVLYSCSDDWAAAAEHVRSAREVLKRKHVDLLPPSAPLMAITALMSARSGRREAALAQLLASRRALATFRTSTPWLNIIARIPLVRATLLLDAHDASRELLAELEYHARFELDRPGKSDAVAAVRVLRGQVESMHRPATGSGALTDAELRVLHYLPSNLSLADIASRLYVSRNTVKTQVANIYRKLGAENRTTAVERARSAGLFTE